MATRKTRLTPQQQDFVEDLGQLMASWGLPRNTGRLYAYLLLRSVPVTLDEIVAELRIAKGGASTGARQLTGFGLARAIGERGSRRIRYEPVYNLEPMYASRRRQFDAFIECLLRGARAATAGAPKQRMNEMAAVVKELEDDLTEVIARAKRKTWAVNGGR